MKISIIIPVYNEKDYIIPTLERVKELNFNNLEKEIIVVDDGSIDGTSEILKSQIGINLISNEKNLGKGGALRLGFEKAQGEIIAIQDADLEYDPRELTKLIEPILNQKAKAVYGSRMSNNNPIGHWRYYFGNLLISFLVNLFFGCNLTDVETGHKVFLKSIVDGLNLKEKGFGVEIEITAKLLKNKIEIIEMPIIYQPRKFSQGKKIKWHDGLCAIWLIAKYRFSKL